MGTPHPKGRRFGCVEGLRPPALKKRTKLVDVRSTLGGKGDSWQQVSPKYNHVRPKWVQGSKSCGRLFRDLHQNFGILFFLIWEIWLSPEAFQNGMPIILDEPAYFLVHPIVLLKPHFFEEKTYLKN